MINKREIANDLITLRDLIRWGTSQFNAAGLSFTQGMPTAIDEAAYLCLSALHLPPDFSVEYFDCVLTMDERLNVLDLFLPIRHFELSGLAIASIDYRAFG